MAEENDKLCSVCWAEGMDKLVEPVLTSCGHMLCWYDIKIFTLKRIIKPSVSVKAMPLQKCVPLAQQKLPIMQAGGHACHSYVSAGNQKKRGTRGHSTEA